MSGERVMSLLSRLAKLVGIWVVVSSMSGCGVQRMQTGEQEVKSEWGTLLFLTMGQLDAVSKAWPAQAGSKSEQMLNEAKEAVRSSMSKWEDIPSDDDIKAGVNAMSMAAVAVDAVLTKAKQEGAKDYESVSSEVDGFRQRAKTVKERYVIAAGTYNDIIRLYPAKWLAKLLMKEPAVSFEDGSKIDGALTQASMLDRLGVARDH